MLRGHVLLVFAFLIATMSSSSSSGACSVTTPPDPPFVGHWILAVQVR